MLLAIRRQYTPKFGMKIGHIDVEVRQGDWTLCASHGAVVNPSNTALIHGAGLAHAIDDAGGPEYMRDLERIRSRHVSSVVKLPVGQAEYTDTTKYLQG
jgi:O-acetyl-ADP-ribose deacetylase (regulator of RNase III)